MHSSPKAPSVVLRTCELSPAGRSSVEPLRTSALPRTDLPSIHPCPASGSASGFLPASALSLHEPLRTPEAEDARCVQPTSATRTNDVHPSAVRSRLSRTTFAARDAPQQSVAVTLRVRGNERFHDARTALVSFLRGPPNALSSCLRPCGFRSRAWAYWTRGARWDETSDTSVANPSSSSRSRHLRACSRFLSRALMVSGQRARVGRVRNPPRPPSPPAREDQKLEMIRGAFHR
jgi:hypothetical protein